MSSANTIPSNWTWTKINEIAFVNPKNDYSDVKSNLPVTFVPMAAVDDISGSIMKPEIMSFEEARKGHTKFLENDIIFARITPCMENGKIAIARNLKNGFGFGSTEFHVIRPKDGILPEYIYHYVRQEKFRNFAADFMTSTVGQLRVSKDVIENAEIPLAPTLEQKRIVSKIEELFKESKSVHEALIKIPIILNKFRHSVLEYAFNNLSDVNVKINEVIESLQPGFACGKRDENGFIQLRMNNIGLRGKIITDSFLRVPKSETNIDKYRLKSGDVIFNNTNSPELVGKTAIFNNEFEDCVYSNHLSRIRVNYDMIIPEFLTYFLVKEQKKGTFEFLCRRFVGQAAVPRESLLKIELPS